MAEAAPMELDSVSGLELEREADIIRHLVRQEKDWLKRVRPDTWQRYRKLPTAVASLGRLVLDGELSAHIIRRGAAVVGLGTIVSQLTVRHPLESETLTGREIDYWTRPGLSNDEHAQAARLLASHNDYHGTVLGILTAAETERAAGIPLIMTPVGRPSHLEVPRAEDRYGIARIPDPLQLYRLEL